MLVKNFLFHRVSPETDQLWPPMKPETFGRIIRQLSNKYEIVLLEDLLRSGIKTSKRLATVLFDDGYKDNIEYAAPILQKYKCPASFYVVTDCINRNIPTWTYLLDHVLQNTKQEKISLKLSAVPDLLRGISLKDKQQVRQLKPWMKKLPNAQRVEVLGEILFQCKDSSLPENKMMSWQDIRELKNASFYIGSHSHTHPMLGALESETEIRQELVTSSEIMEKELGEKPLTISYPIGSFDQRVTRLAKETGYQYGLAVEQRFYSPLNDDIMAIPRVELYEEPSWKTNLRISGLYQKARKLWK